MRSRWLAMGVSLTLVASGGWRGLGAQGRGGQDSRPGIAVLPFDNSGSYGQDKENFDALQKGIAGMLISELAANPAARVVERSEEHTSELQSQFHLVCRLLLEKKNIR